MKGNYWTETFPWYNGSNYHWSTFLLHCWERAVRVVNIFGMPPHINSRWSWEKRKTVPMLEYDLLPLVCTSGIVISVPFQPLLNVARGEMRFLYSGSSIISSFMKLTESSFSRYLTTHMIIQISSHFGRSTSMVFLPHCVTMHVGTFHSVCKSSLSCYGC